MSHKYQIFNKIATTIKNHKEMTLVVAVICVIGFYGTYKAEKNANALPQYTLAMARIGTLTQTVTGSGQVSASNQTDIQSQVSGTIQTINVKVGDSVYAGQLIATIDPTNAAISLKNAKLSLAKLTQPVKETDMSNSVAGVNKAYSDAFNTLSSVYLDLPSIMNGMKNMFYGSSGFLGPQHYTYLDGSSLTYRNNSASAYDLAAMQYASSLAEFSATNRNSATSSIDKLLTDTYNTLKLVSQAASQLQTTITYITTNQPDYQSGSASSATSNVNTWASQANSDVASIITAQNSIQTSQNSLTNLVQGTDALDIQTAELSVEQAQRTYNNYFIRAPYDGVIGRIPVNVYAQAGASTVIATIVGQQKIASISLNEVDAAKVKTGQDVNITFDAIDGLNATGTVEEVDQIGTVSQGVVSYGVKILINTQDDRIKPGMSVNTSIITNVENGVVLVPSSAVKKSGTQNYVQTFDPSDISALSGNSNVPAFGSTTRRFGSGVSATSSSTDQLGTSTGGRFGMGSLTGQYSGTKTGQSRTPTISTATLPTQTPVTVGDSDDTYTVILSGLNRGTMVVTKTVAASASNTTAPSILSSLGASGRTSTTRQSGSFTSGATPPGR